MKLFYLTIPAALLLSAAGVALVYDAHRDNATGLVNTDPRHPITADMASAASSQAALTSPVFNRQDSDGKWIDLRKMVGTKPIYLIFIMDGCPCSLEAQPFFQRLSDAYGDKVQFLGITDGKTEVAKDWKARFQTTFPIISCPSKDLMYMFAAKHSAYSALVDTNGKLVKLWPGYSQELLSDINTSIAQTLHSSTPEVTVADAPLKPTSGCVFE